MYKKNSSGHLFLTVAFAVLISGCAGQQTRMKSSVVDYLYPKSSETVVEPSVPVLKIPIKVGIAFVPEQRVRSQGVNMWAGIMGGGSLTEVNKAGLLDRVADHFRKQEFISDIEVIPSPYLTAGGGFSNLEQIRTMYGIDVIALVAYDQVQFTDEGLLSFAYWTLIGAYIVSGEKNDTSTMMDTAVYDIQSKKMLFRAPGTSNVKSRSTPVNLSEELRDDSIKSFNQATDAMIINLDKQLARFKEKIKSSPEQVKIVKRGSYSGGGVPGIIDLAILLLLILTVLIRNKLKAVVTAHVPDRSRTEIRDEARFIARLNAAKLDH